MTASLSRRYGQGVRLRLPLLLLVLLPLALALASPSKPVQSPSPSPTRVSVNNNTVLFLWRDGIVQIVSTPPGKAAPIRPPPSLTVVAEANSPPKHSVTTNASCVVVTTAAFTLFASVATGAVSVVRDDGTIVLQEAERSFVQAQAPDTAAWRVEQQWVAQTDERIYGLGQYQNGAKTRRH